MDLLSSELIYLVWPENESGRIEEISEIDPQLATERRFHAKSQSDRVAP